jgi:hypothetical protein
VSDGDFVGDFVRDKFGVALGMSSSGSVSSHLPLDLAAASITLTSPYVFVPLPAPELLPPVTLDVPHPLARSTVGSGSSDASVLLSSNSVGVGAGRLNLSSLFLLSQGRLSWVRRFVLLFPRYSLLNLSKDTIGRLGISGKVTQ